MNRDPLLMALSRDHHRGLVMTGRIKAYSEDRAALAQLCDFVFQRFSTELVPHFQNEEERIFPVLKGIHEEERLRAVADHQLLTELSTRIADGDLSALVEFGHVLAAHMRFEERVLFPLYEALTRQS